MGHRLIQAYFRRTGERLARYDDLGVGDLQVTVSWIAFESGRGTLRASVAEGYAWPPAAPRVALQGDDDQAGFTYRIMAEIPWLAEAVVALAIELVGPDVEKMARRMLAHAREAMQAE